MECVQSFAYHYHLSTITEQVFMKHLHCIIMYYSRWGLALS